MTLETYLQARRIVREGVALLSNSSHPALSWTATEDWTAEEFFQARGLLAQTIAERAEQGVRNEADYQSDREESANAVCEG